MLKKMIMSTTDFIYLRLKSLIYDLISIPKFLANKVTALKNNIENFKYRITHLAESNFQLGLYHLEHNNLNDAIMRFKLVSRFFNSNNLENKYWLSVAYYFQGNIKEALQILEHVNNAKALEFKNFLKNIDNCSSVPINIWNQSRDITAEIIELRNPIFVAENITNLIKLILTNIESLPQEYKILELGSNVGSLGAEIKKRFPDTGTLTGIESSQKMHQIQTQKVKKDYDESILLPNYNFFNFLNEKKQKFDIVITCLGIALYKDLTATIQEIREIISLKGYFIACLRVASQTGFIIKKQEFCYNADNIIDLLMQNNFDILYHEIFQVPEKEDYLIVICRK